MQNPGKVQYCNLSGASQTWLNGCRSPDEQPPGKAPGWKTPAEAMAEEIAAFKPTFALDA